MVRDRCHAKITMFLALIYLSELQFLIIPILLLELELIPLVLHHKVARRLIMDIVYFRLIIVRPLASPFAKTVDIPLEDQLLG